MASLLWSLLRGVGQAPLHLSEKPASHPPCILAMYLQPAHLFLPISSYYPPPTILMDLQACHSIHPNQSKTHINRRGLRISLKTKNFHQKMTGLNIQFSQLFEQLKTNNIQLNWENPYKIINLNREKKKKFRSTNGAT